MISIWAARSVGHGGGGRLVDQVAVAERSMVNGALIGCGSSRAIVCANTCAEPGVALNPPVPQPQLT
jgi:hypothetical protein